MTNIEPEHMKAPIDLKPSQNDSRTLFDQTNTCFVENKERYTRTQHPLQDIALYASIVNNNKKGSERAGRYPTR